MKDTSYAWAVIGAGPAGIAAVGKLIDNGIAAQDILWLDPEFKAGDFGTRWRHVPSNTRVGHFLKFFNECHSFEFTAAPRFPIQDIPPVQTCELKLAADVLQWITNTLCNKVVARTGKVGQLKLYNRYWHITQGDQEFRASNVVLAIGAEPKSLDYPGVEEISLVSALDPLKLPSLCQPQDIIAVFGSSHSAMLVLQTLAGQCNVKKIVNFYLSPLRYAVYFDDYILFNDTGLKGTTAEWARTHIDGEFPKNLQRVIGNEANIRVSLPLCNKVIYATGFQKRLIPVEGMESLKYNDRNGIIAPGLFGLGIAFPEAKVDRFGTLEYRVGLWKFMDYLNNVMPVWLRYNT
jgi:hypothetical protein